MCNSHITNIPRLHLGLSAADQSRYLLCPLSHTFSAVAVNNGTSLLPTYCSIVTQPRRLLLGITVAILHNECIVLHIMVRADNSITVTH